MTLQVLPLVAAGLSHTQGPAAVNIWFPRPTHALPPSQRPPSAKIPGSGLTPCALTLQQVASPAMERASPGCTTQAPASLLPAGVLPTCTQHGAGAQQSYTGLGEHRACSFTPHPRSHGSLAWNLILGPSPSAHSLGDPAPTTCPVCISLPHLGSLSSLGNPRLALSSHWVVILSLLSCKLLVQGSVTLSLKLQGVARLGGAKWPNTSTASPSPVRSPREHRPAGWGSGAALHRVGIQVAEHLCSLPPFLLQLLQLSSPGGQRGGWGSGHCHAECVALSALAAQAESKGLRPTA